MQTNRSVNLRHTKEARRTDKKRLTLNLLFQNPHQIKSLEVCQEIALSDLIGKAVILAVKGLLLVFQFNY